MWTGRCGDVRPSEGAGLTVCDIGQGRVGAEE